MATLAPLTARQRWVNLLKTSLVPLAILNLYLMPFDLRFLSLFEQSGTRVDDAMSITAIFTLLVYSHPAGRHMTKISEVLFFAPLVLIILGSFWYDWGLSFPSSAVEGIDDKWPMWLPQYWVRPGQITGKSLQAVVLAAFANNQALALLISGKFAMLDRARPWMVSTRTRRIVLTTCLVCGIFWLKKTALEYPLTFDSGTVDNAGRLHWWTEIGQAWVKFANPMRPHPKGSWGLLIRFNVSVAFLQTVFFFRMRGGGVFYTVDRNTWKSSIVIEPSLPSTLKAEDFYGRVIRLNADGMDDHNTMAGKTNGDRDKSSTATVLADMEGQSTRRWWNLPLALNIGLLSPIFNLVADLLGMPKTFGWTPST